MSWLASFATMPMFRPMLAALALAAASCAHAPPPPPAPPRVVIVGDSTASAYGRERWPRMGWGMVLGCGLDGVAVENRAVSGRSTKSYQDEGRWAATRAMLRRGDVLLIQFGHNDEKTEDPARFTDADGVFAANLARFIAEARAAGATPVLVTPVARRKFVAGRVVDTHGGYDDAVRRLATETHTPLIDLSSDSMALIEREGPERSKRLFLHFQSSQQVAAYPQGVEDDTHFSEAGARVIAGLVARRLAVLDTPVRAHVRPDAPGLQEQTLGGPRCDGPSRAMAVIADADVRREEPPPHGGFGSSTAFRISDAAPERLMEFRKRTLAPGSAIGLHPIEHDEVYHVLSGEGVVTSDGKSAPLRAGQTAYLYEGAVVGIRQTGSAPLELVIAYPLKTRTP